MMINPVEGILKLNCDCRTFKARSSAKNARVVTEAIPEIFGNIESRPCGPAIPASPAIQDVAIYIYRDIALHCECPQFFHTKQRLL